MKTIIIAEAGVNHNGNIELAKKLIDVAAEAKVDFVKFQTFKAEKLVSSEAKKAQYQKSNMAGDTDDSQFNMLKKLELSEENHLTLIEYCNTKKVQFLSTGFDEDSVSYLYKLGLRLFKIPSGEITNKTYLRHIAALAETVILSTGMSTLEEIKEAVATLTDAGLDISKITILHCNTEYPTPFSDVNLLAMRTIANELKTNVGYSDHTIGIEVSVAAVALGAKVIEKHFTLDRNMEGPDHRASLEPDELFNLVKSIRNIEASLGNGVKEPSESEKKNIVIARKSIHLKREIHAGEALKIEDLIMLRPGDGISPMLIDDLIGKKLNKRCPKGYKLSINDLSI